MRKCDAISRDAFVGSLDDRRFTSCMLTELTKDSAPAPTPVTAWEGNTVKLPCLPFARTTRVIAMDVTRENPILKPSYYWIKDGQQRILHRQKGVAAFSAHCEDGHCRLRRIPDGDLWIQNVKLADEGVYACSYQEECRGRAEGGSAWCILYIGSTYRVTVKAKERECREMDATCSA
ncbi:uncharacterized protein LOC129599832 [Paramacrobiotus metropolitanus]|uniref:uncharacterized protein LOC129599832 n=1 Tax=Paramacrobiotus metropolitanus TaxID=2943436 RepID=UPI002446279F|nr:uncharacterized protein LOC129599832 [Paramacrobiotus metropolitanus]